MSPRAKTFHRHPPIQASPVHQVELSDGELAMMRRDFGKGSGGGVLDAIQMMDRMGLKLLDVRITDHEAPAPNAYDLWYALH